MDTDSQDAIVNEYASIDLADGRIQSSESLKKDLENIRTDGLFISTSERSRGTVSMTAPIRNGHDDVIASLTIAGHDGIINGDAILEHQSLVLQAARRISSQMH
nr:IclR family transcriptional regulator C-terminal domain-containing protein [Corynebacterium crudilactis]